MKNLVKRGVILLFAAVAGIAGCDSTPIAGQQVAHTTETVPVRVSVVFGGDVMQHMPQINAARQGGTYDYTETFAHLKPFIDSADITVFNLETTLATQDFSGYPLFSAPSELASALRECGVDAVTLANNHMLDKGREGVL